VAAPVAPVDGRGHGHACSVAVIVIVVVIVVVVVVVVIVMVGPLLLFDYHHLASGVLRRRSFLFGSLWFRKGRIFPVVLASELSGGDTTLLSTFGKGFSAVGSRGTTFVPGSVPIPAAVVVVGSSVVVVVLLLLFLRSTIEKKQFLRRQ